MLTGIFFPSRRITACTLSPLTATGKSVSSVTDSGDHTTYDVTVTATGDGTILASLTAGTVTDAAGNGSAASTSTDNTVTYDLTPLTVTVNQAPAQADPTSAAPLHFTVVFNKRGNAFHIITAWRAGRGARRRQKERFG